MRTVEHPYKPRLGLSVFGTLFFAACAIVMADAARGNDRGLIINGIIRLDAHGATTFYWTVAAVSALFVAMFLVMLARGLFSKGTLSITATELSAPRSPFARTNTVVPRAGIQRVDVQAVNRQRFLHVYHPGGTLTILQSCLPSNAAFDEVCAALRQP